MIKNNPNITPPILCTVIIAILILVCLIGVTLWYFFFPGINRLFDYVHFNLEEQGYVLSPEGEILNEASLTAKGTVKRHSSGKASNREEYDFYFEISGFPTVKNIASLWDTGNSNAKLNTSWQDVDLIGDGEQNQIQVNSQIDYKTCLDSKYRNIIGCKIESKTFDDGGSCTIETVGYFVPAKNEEDARAQFDLLLEAMD